MCGGGPHHQSAGPGAWTRRPGKDQSAQGCRRTPPFTDRTQCGVRARHLRPQTAPNLVAGDPRESVPSRGCPEPQALVGLLAPDCWVERCLLPAKWVYSGTAAPGQREAAAGTRLRGTAALSQSPLDRAGSRKCTGFSLAGLLLGREKIFLPAAGAAAPVPGSAVGGGLPTPPE